MHLVQDRNQCQVLVNTVMNLQDPYKAGNFSRRTLLHEVSYSNEIQ
jgi:hypothetical protein